MRRLLSKRAGLIVMGLAGMLALAAGVGESKVKAAGAVKYTWTLTALGQFGWIGGPLFDDGTVGGGGNLSTDNGQTIARLVPTTWSEDADENITVCFDLVQKKGGGLPSSLCVGPAAVTGTPIHMTLFGFDHIFRITEVGK